MVPPPSLSLNGTLLLVSSVAALVMANSRWAHGYDQFWSVPLFIGVPTASLSLTLHEWVNDALMAVFFLHVGLEIKRELVVGELSSVRQAALPIAGALCGMVVPALIYVGVTVAMGSAAKAAVTSAAKARSPVILSAAKDPAG